MSITLRAKRILTGALAGALVLGLLPAGVASAATTACEGAASNQFADSNPTHQANIDCIAAYNVVSGFANGTFGGSQNITRGQMATFIANFAATTVNVDITDIEVASHTFTDVAGNVHADNIARIFGLGVTAGRTATTFAPNDTITRAEAATMLANAHVALGVDLTGVTPSTAFTDLGTSVHADNINILAGAGVVSGKTATTFAPSASILRAEAATLLVRSITVLRSQNLWDAPALVAPTTNQTFTVTSADVEVLEKEEGERTFVAQVGDAEKVTVALVDVIRGDLTVENNKVSFKGNGTAKLYDDGIDITLVTTGEGDNQVTVHDAAETTTTTTTGSVVVTVIDGVVEFTLTSTAPDGMVPVVFVADGDGNLAIDDDGLPENDFGIGGATYWVALENIEIVAAVSGDVDGDVFPVDAPFEGSVTATFDLVNDGFTVPAAGQELLLYAVRGDVGATFDPFNADNPNFDVDGELIVDGLKLTIGADNKVEFTWDGPADPQIDPEGGPAIVDTLFVQWVGTDALEAEDAEHIIDNATVDWVVDDAEADAFEFTVRGEDAADEDEFLQLIGSSVPVTVTVTDRFGRAVEGVDVAITNEDGLPTVNRTTNASGVASANLSSPAANIEVEYTIDVEGVGDDQTFKITWYEVYDPEADGAGEIEGAALLAINTEGGYVIVEIVETAGPRYLGVVYTDADFFELVGNELIEADSGFVTQAAWVAEVEAQLDQEALAGTLTITTKDFTEDDEDNVITLTADE